VRIELSEAARRDVERISRYTLQQWGPVQEEKYLNLLWAEFQEIQKKPDRFRTRNDLFPNCQIAPIGSHLILFRALSGVVQIARVLHGSMDFTQHIPKEFRQGTRRRKL
jgi:toxin ParE1/3/4